MKREMLHAEWHKVQIKLRQESKQGRVLPPRRRNHPSRVFMQPSGEDDLFS
jgi:hypothetical protein